MRKKLEKIIALLISLMMLTISCEFYISAVSAELINSITIGLPVIKEIIAVENFEGTNISENWDLILDDGNITQEDGRLKIVGVSGSGQTLARYTPLLGDTAKGMIGVEFYLEKANAERAYIYIRPASGHFFSGQWRENGDIYGYYRDNPDAEAVNRKIGNIHPTEKAHFMFLFDTEKEIFSLWINGNLIIDKKLSRTPEIKDVRCIEIYPRPTSDATIYVERLKVYHAIPLLEDALDYDYEWLTDTILLKGNPNAYAGDVIDSDLHLPKKARFISDITWHSSDETLITNEGKVTRPVGGLSDPEVTLTATLSAKGLTREKIFKFKVLRLLTSSEDIVNADYEFLDYSTLSMDKSNRVRTSINFMEKGMYGSDIVWSSSDTSAITQSGRVIRPKVGEPDKEVEVTAVIRYGDVSRVKKFNFTVLADEEFVDPQYASDEEFFGVWDQSKEKWSIPGSINYSYSNELKPVEEAVKMGNYSLAKEALLTYFRNKDYPAVTSTLTDLGAAIREEPI